MPVDNTKHFPKKVRFTIVNRIQDHVLSIYEKLLAANEIYPIQNEEDKARRLSLQRDALTACKMLLFFIELSKKRGYIDTGTFDYWIHKTPIIFASGFSLSLQLHYIHDKSESIFSHTII